MIKKGDIFLFENVSAQGHVQRGIRPHLLVTAVVGNVVTMAPLTSSAKRSDFPFSVVIKPDKQNKLHSISVVLLNQLLTCDISALGRKVGHLTETDTLKVQVEFIKMISM